MEELSYDAGNVRTAPVTIGGTSLVPELPQEGIIIDKLDEIAAMVGSSTRNVLLCS